MTTKYSKAEIEEAKTRLREWIKPGDTVYTSLKHVSRSGMYRAIDLFVMLDNKPVRISGYAACLLEGYDDKHEACRASGCGMDMGFHLVYNLSYVLFPEYDCPAYSRETNQLREYPYTLCPSPDHVNRGGQQNNSWHKDGYALRQEWL